MKKPYLSVIIPAYNEAKRLPLTLADIDNYLTKKAKFSYEIVVVNDGSTDETADIIKRFIPLVKNLRLINNEENKGKGGVVRQGMLEAKGEIRLFTDADNSTSIDQFEEMIPFFDPPAGRKKFSVVIGSRSIKGARLEPAQPIYRQIPGKLGNLIIQALVLPRIWDTQCGFKAFRKEAAEKIFSLSRISGWGFDVEALALAKQLGYEIKEIPVRWVNNEFSHVKPTTYLKVLWETLKIKYWIIKDEYGIGAPEKK